MKDTIMAKSGLPRSIRKFIRLEKARIRAQFFDVKKQEEMINELYNRFSKTEELKDQRTEEQKIGKVKATKETNETKGTKSKIKEQKAKIQIKKKKEEKVKSQK